VTLLQYGASERRVHFNQNTILLRYHNLKGMRITAGHMVNSVRRDQTDGWPTIETHFQSIRLRDEPA
jgi:hypothetical protein